MNQNKLSKDEGLLMEASINNFGKRLEACPKGTFAHALGALTPLALILWAAIARDLVEK